MLPKLDERTKEDIIKEIRQLAEVYTPGWRFNPEHPDIGTVLAELFAGLMAATVDQYNRIPEYCLDSFLAAMGVEPKPPEPASGFLVFGLAGRELPGSVVMKGTEVAADLPGRGLIDYYTAESVYVTAAGVRLYSGEEAGIWYLCFDRHPGQGVISLLFLLSAGHGRAAGITWTYQMAAGQWGMLLIQDGTKGFADTGIVRFLVTDDWILGRHFEQDGYWIRISSETAFLSLADRMSVFVNAARIVAKEPGTGGNLPAGSKWKLLRQTGYVSAADNPESICGGSDCEDAKAALQRGCARNRHRFRAVTPGDFEQLTYEVFPHLERAVCFSGLDEQGQRLPGAVTLVILAAQFRTGTHYFTAAKRRLMDWLFRHSSEILINRDLLFVTLPVFVAVTVSAALQAKTYEDILTLQGEVPDILRQFLDDRGGNYHQQGWELGRLPEYEQIKSHLFTIPGITGVGNLKIKYSICSGNDETEVLWEEIRQHPWTLPKAGTCMLSVTGEGGRRWDDYR